MNKPKLLVYASGSFEGGGSGFRKLALAAQNGSLNAEIVGVVSNYTDGGVSKHASELGIPFRYFPKPWTAEEYQKIALESGAEFFALSGWLKLVSGLDPETTFNSRTVFNIHPGPLPTFGGAGMYGHHVHKAVMEAYKRGEVTHSAVSMHFVDEEFDRGPKFFDGEVEIEKNDDADTLGTRVNQIEHQYQPEITNMVINGLITWDGVNPDSLTVPPGYSIKQNV